MKETLERAARAAHKGFGKRSGYVYDWEDAFPSQETFHDIASAVLTSLSDPTPECVEAMARALAELDIKNKHLTTEQRQVLIAHNWKAYETRARASHAAFIRYVEGK
jgi:hypothetical protein